MSESQIDRIQRLFHQALDQPEDVQASWLRSRCGADENLLQEVRSLLEHGSPHDDPLEGPRDQTLADLDQTMLGNDSLHKKDMEDHRDTIVDGDVFLSHLARIGVLSDGEISALHDSHSGKYESSDPSLLASQLVTEGKLSDFQAQALLRGQPELLLDKYLIVDLIGSGGMGTVFKAIHRPMNRIVAIKMISNHLLDSSAQLQRFKREVRVAATLENVNIVRAYDADQFAGAHFFVMEFVRGENLANTVQRDGPLTVQKAVNCIRQAANGLRYAHGRGVVHRDVKPGNLMMTDAGLVKVLDLGLATVDDSFRLVQRSTEVVSAERLTHVGGHLTQVGAVLGTAAFMAPEQSQDAGLADPRSDIYSLGCTLYFLLMGEPPVKGSSTSDLLEEHRSCKIPSLQVSRPDVPKSIDAIFRRMVAKDPLERFSSMGELIAAIDDSGVSGDLGRERTSRKQDAASTGTLDLKRDVVSRASSSRRAIWLFATFAGLIGLCVIGYAIGEFPASPSDAGIEIDDRGHAEFSAGIGILQFNGTSITDALLANSLKGQADLTELHLANTNISDEGMASIGLCQKLEVLHLDGTGVTSQGLRHLSGLRNLRVLGLARTLVDDAGLQHLQRMKNLEWLTLEGTVISGGGLVHLSDCQQLDSLNLASTDLSSEQLSHLKSLHNLRRLELAYTGVDDAGIAQLSQLANLQYLHLDFTPITDEGLAQLVDLAGLSVLFLRGTQLTDDGVAHLRDLGSLRDLYLAKTEITDQGLQHLMDLDLRKLDLYMTQVTNTGVEQLRGFPNLNWLHLGSTHITDEGLAHVGSLCSLQTLFLDGTHITDDGLVWLKGLENLRDLHLGQTKITDRGLEILQGLDLRILALYKTQVTNTGVDRLAGFANLTWLNLGATQISDEGIGHLRELKNLRELRLDRTNVTSDGIEHVKSLPNLVRLYLNGTKIDDGALEELKGLTSLERLDIRGTGLTDAGYNELKRALPDCELPMHGNDRTRGMAMMQKQADLYASRQDWGKARQTYRRLVSLNPKTWLSWTELMDVAQWEDKAKGNSLDSSIAIYNEAVEALGEDRLDLGIEMVHCLSCLLTDRPAEYERVCQIVANKYLNSDVPRTQFQVAKILALGEEPIVAPNDLVSIARQAIKTDPAKPYFRQALTLSLIRAGKYDEAITSCDGNAALIAFAHAKSGDDDEARRWLKLAREEIQDNPLDPRSTWLPAHRMSWRLYLRETERLLAEQ